MAQEAQEQKGSPPALLVTPPNKLKEKVGNGGFDKNVLAKAQNMLESNAVEFEPTGLTLVQMLDELIREVQAGSTTGEAAVEALLYPAMQLRAQGAMFHYPLITEISDTLIDFLETVRTINDDVLAIVIAHKVSMRAVLSKKMKGSGKKPGTDLAQELVACCNRYYKSRNIAK